MFVVLGVPVSSLALPRAGRRWPINYATRPANTNDEDPYNASISITDDAIRGRMSLSCKRRNCHDRHLSSLPSLAPMASTTRSSRSPCANSTVTAMTTSRLAPPNSQNCGLTSTGGCKSWCQRRRTGASGHEKTHNLVVVGSSPTRPTKYKSEA